MVFVFSKIATVLLRPSTLALLLAVLGAMLLWTRRRRLGRAVLAGGLAGLLLIQWSPIGDWMLLPLEERFPRAASAPDEVDGIIVLGGAVEPALTEEHGIPALNGAAERMTAFLALARRYPQARLLFTGGDGTLSTHALSEADVARTLFSQLGLPPDRVIFEARSRNTYENVVFSKALVKPRPGEKWILITSAAHMPRSVALFRHADWPVLPWPVGYKSTRNLDTWYNLSLGQRIDVTDAAAREWIGLVSYRLMGRTGEMWPMAENASSR